MLTLKHISAAVIAAALASAIVVDTATLVVAVAVAGSEAAAWRGQWFPRRWDASRWIWWRCLAYRWI